MGGPRSPVTAAAVPVLLSGMTAAYAKVEQPDVKYQQSPKNGQKSAPISRRPNPAREINPEGCTDSD
jgi:hypothetical protein